MSAVPPETVRRQRLATDPGASAFVSANAGSGKTYVLTRRVIRLMLAGCDPGRILCLTFTKAAAAEMANRVFALLGRWATVPDAVLAAEIAEIEAAAPSRERLLAARRLFARALETPGGLKVQTIHAFAEALLQRFSVEANLSGRFEVLDDRAAALLRAEAKARTVRETVAAPDGPVAQALAELLADTADDTVDRALAAMVDEREAFLAWVRRHHDLAAALAALPVELGVPAGTSEADVVAAIPDGAFGPGLLAELLPVLDGAGANSVKLARAFRDALDTSHPEARAEAWAAVFCKDDGSPRSAKSAIVNAVEAALPGTRERFAAEAERIGRLLSARAAFGTARRTAALARLADRTIGHYQALKAAAGALDYDDLILRAATLLSRSDAAAWVQYKLDQGLDHILVDEAQDTSPAQWRIVRALAGDFFAGEGARGRTVRTLFAVGDEKQSIYSFQGAAPELFGATRRDVAGEVRGAGGAFHQIELTVSFRSAPDVVKGVDRVFAAPEAHAGLTSGGGGTVHETVRGDAPGLVEVWPETEAEKAPEPERWEDPVDRVGRGGADRRLAERVADEIAGWVARGEPLG
ncbi:UvrD-helicase domain-containing protein, partial [Oharaeibacter diazotrophicus]